MAQLTRRLVLACPGPLDPAAVAEARGAGAQDVIAVTLDLGEGRQLEAVRDGALAAGATRAHVLDVRDQFARDFVLPALQAGALSDTGRPVVAALADALWAAKLVEIATIEEAGAIGLASDRNPRLATLVRALASGGALTAIAAAPALPAIPLWPGRPADHRPATAAASEVPASADIGFDRGVPVAVNRIAMPVAELASSLIALAGAEQVRSPLDILQNAHTALRNAACDSALGAFADRVAAEYRAILDEGRWFSPLRLALDGFVGRVQPAVTGSVRLTMHQGAWSIARTTPSARFD